MRHILVIAGLFFLLNAVTKAQMTTAAEEPLVKVVEKTLPAVVNITAEHLVQGRINDPYSVYFGRYYSAPQGSLGSGVFVSADGFIITCAHVVDGADKGMVKITLSNGAIYQARVVSSDSDQDLALLKVVGDPEKFPYLETKLVSPNLLGQTVVALGNPVGYQSSVSRGILSAKNRTVNTDQGKVDGLLQTDAAINPGNSGGPMVDIEGKFVGISSAKVAGEAIGGLGFGIPGDVAAAWTADAIAIAKGEKVAPKPVSLVEIIQKRFGLGVQELTPELAQSFNLPSTQGLLVADVEKGTPADKAQIIPGMLLIRLGGVPVYNEGSLPRQLSRVKPGDEVVFTLAISELQNGFTVQRSFNFTLTSR